MARASSRRSGGRNNNSRAPQSPDIQSAAPPSPPELIVVAHPDAGLRASAGRFLSVAGAPTDSLESILAAHGATLLPLFGPTEERVLASTTMLSAVAASDAADLARFYKVDAPPEALAPLQSDLATHDLVEAAYVKPGSEPAAFLNDMAPSGEEAPPSTPDYATRQIYLDAAPAGVEARWAWTQAGGRGRGVRIIDIEGAWRFTHEDLTVNQGGVVGGTPTADQGWRNHGTAVLGEFSGDDNSIGIVGIASDAVVSGISIFPNTGSSAAINAAAARLGAGDVILIELHRPGPRNNFANRNDQAGYIAIEWWPDDFVAIRNAVNKGIIVIEAGGNGAENLDDPIYQNPATGFPAGWSNPFRRSNRDSGAVVVGAGAPPPGTHGRTYGPDRSRLDFSNWGSVIDAQGWGREVTTTGYGDLQGGSSEDLWYTDTFSGTSSASPILVGVAASIQGMAKARGHPPIAPADFRSCLRSTGSAQQDAPGRPATQRIGNRPNLRQLVTCHFGKGKEIQKEVIKEKEFAKDLKDQRKEIKEKEVKEKEFAKELKDQRKELKEKDVKEKEFAKELKDQRKEFKEKDLKERDKPPKEIKEKDKDSFEGGGFQGGGVLQGGGPDANSPGGLEARLSNLEQSVAGLIHFIGADLRPDLSSSALSNDGQDLSGGDEQAKSYKDQKDSESY